MDTCRHCGEPLYTPEETLRRLLPKKYWTKAKLVEIIILTHGTDNKLIVRDLKLAGIIAPSTYWGDVKGYKRLQEVLVPDEDARR